MPSDSRFPGASCCRSARSRVILLGKLDTESTGFLTLTEPKRLALSWIDRAVAASMLPCRLEVYQALVDSVERKPRGSTPLVAKAELVSAPAPGLENPLTGTWTYADGSQQFNGVAEPKQVILELWMEKGFLLGRYRAQLTDFDGPRQVDISLRGKALPGKTQTLEFPQEGGQGNGKILLQGPGPSGIDLMLVRSVEAGGTIPRGP